MISSYIDPDTPDMTSIFSDITADILLVKNTLGQAYIPSLAINSIGNWMLEQGYMVKASNPNTLVMGCAAVNPSTTPISLTAGWAIIAYLRTSGMDAALALSDITDSVLIVKNVTGTSYIPSLGINTIGDMLPGQGYKIKMSGTAILHYPE